MTMIPLPKPKKITLSEAIEVLKNTLKAWDKLTPGMYNKSTIEFWLLEDMKPAIDKIRETLNSVKE